jgi:outer membrane immunogenic protein
MNSKLKTAIFGGLLALLPFGASYADDGGFYLGGSLGQAGVELDLGGGTPGIPAFDEDDTAWKLFGGYKFDLLPVLKLSVEGGYVDLGGPSLDVTAPGVDASLGVDTTAFDIFGVAGFDLGPVGVFGKLGYVFWDADLTLVDRLDPSNNESFSEDGSDLAYGIGASIGLGSLEVRGEYELFDLEDSEDVSMWSVGLVWYFN